MALLASTPTRGVADIMEASLIFHLEYSALNLDNNLNFSRYPFARDVGDDELHLEYYVYIVLEELPPGKAWRQANDSFATRPSLALCESAVSARLTALFQRERAIMKFIGRNMRYFQEALNASAEAGVIRRERRWVQDENDLDELAQEVMRRIEDANEFHELTASAQAEASGQAAASAQPEASNLIATAGQLMNDMESMTRRGVIGGERRRIEDDNEFHELTTQLLGRISNDGHP